MSDQQDISGPASRDKLERLWAALLDAFGTALEADKVPSSEMFGCVRLFLRDNNIKATPEQVAQLQALHRHLLARLVALMASESGPSATGMETIRRFLVDNSVQKDAGMKAGLDQLSDLSLPFVH